MMKINSLTTTILMTATMLSSLTFTSCSEYDNDDPEPQPVTPVTPGTIDTAEWPFDACIDSTDAPGNDFYKYISIGYVKTYGKGLGDQQIDLVNQFYEECTNSNSTALKALNKWKETSATEIHQCEMDALDSYCKSIEGKTNKELLKEIIHLGTINDLPIINTAQLNLLRKPTIMVGVSWNMNDNYVAALVNKAGYSKEKIAELYNNAIILKQLIPGATATSSSAKVTSRAGNTESQQVLLEGLSLNTDDIDMISDLQGNLTKTMSFIDNILKYGENENLHKSLVSYLELCRMILSYQITGMTETVTSVNFLTAPFCKLLYSNEYINKKITADNVKPCQELTIQIRNTFSSRLDSLDWMSPSTKKYAKEKLSNMYFWYGLPKSSPSTFDVAINSDTDFNTCPTETYITLQERFYTNTVLPQMRRRTYDDDLIYLTRSMQEEYMSFIHNAFYDRYTNTMNILASNLIAPFTRNDVSLAYLYGVLGSTISHEICHGFDADGSKYDATGNTSDWWALSDKLKYKEKQEALVNLFNQYEFTDFKGATIHINGTQTLDENIADLGGFTIALDAFTRLRRSQGYDDAGIREQTRRYFLALGIALSEQTLYNHAYYTLPTDGHSPFCIRMNAIPSLMDEWYDIFNVKWGDKYYLEPSQRIKLW